MFGHLQTDIRYGYRIDPPLLRSELIRDSLYEEFKPFRGFEGVE